MLIVSLFCVTEFPIKVVDWMGEGRGEENFESSNVQVFRDVKIFVARAERSERKFSGKSHKVDYEKCFTWKFLWLFELLVSGF